MRSGLANAQTWLNIRPGIWEQFLDLKAIDFADFDPLIYRSIEIKNEIVMLIPQKKNIRKALNFGHTLMQLKATFSKTILKPLYCTESYSAGMVLEVLFLHKNLINQEEYFQIKSTKSIYGIIVFDENDIEPILELLIHDKKNEYGTIQFALLDGIGKIKINQSVENELILEAFFGL
jgi:3-dehydroquinate synthase